MQYLHGSENLYLPSDSAVTLGKFDGVHRGHQKLIRKVKKLSEERGLLSAAFTFDHIPLRLLPPSGQHFLSTNEERRHAFEELGLDYELEFPFTDHLMNMSAQEFIEDILVRRLRARAVVVGSDYHFGKGRAGDVNMLAESGKKAGFETFVMEKERWRGREISSTLIRQKLGEARMEDVEELLGHPYPVMGVVALGNQLGRKMDMPTLNLYPQARKFLPPNGVYASRTKLGGRIYDGVTDIGIRPTVDQPQPQVRVETNLFGYESEGEDYGSPITVWLYKFIRPEIKFADLAELQNQMHADAKEAEKYLQEHQTL
ncbi:MAG: bifunctional riboflavin kinase/FAD synthetase [Lachnospiraceae bacterium]|jgi:riboflavin kinase/FMN adenylyltransferase